MADLGAHNFGMPRSKELEHDPDYEKIYVNHRAEELEELKQDAKEATIRKINDVIHHCFSQEILHKESELIAVQKTLSEAKSMMDNLRACIITKYYYQDFFKGKEEAEAQDWIHPEVKLFTGKRPSYGCAANVLADHNYPNLEPEPLENKPYTHAVVQKTKAEDTITSGTTVRKNVKLLVGNISKYIFNEEKNSSQDQATHKWMIYVRPQDSLAEDNDLISRVVVFLHPSYKPNDLVEITAPPFCVCRRGWGEFPVRVQIHFHNPRNKPVDVIHQLKLDKTFTGLQTLGGETLVEVPLYTSKDESASMLSQNVKSVRVGSRTLSSDNRHNSVDPPVQSLLKLQSSDSLVDSNDLDSDSATTVSQNHLFKQELNEMIDSIRVQKQTSDTLSTTILSPEALLPNCKTLLENVNSVDTCLKSAENYDSVCLKSREVTPVISVKPKLNDLTSSSAFHNDSSSVPQTNGLNNSVKPDFKSDSYLRIASAVPIQITVRSKPEGTSGVATESVLYIKPNASGLCLVPISLLKSRPESKTSASSSQISWKLKLVKFKKKLDRFISNLRTEEYGCIREIMLHLIKIYPIISKDPDFPYCASSEDQFHSWTIGRKLAAEWQRSRQVQKALHLIIGAKLIAEKPWSVKEIFRWARKYGYTPRKVHFDSEEESVTDKVNCYGLTSSEQLLNTLMSQEITSDEERRILPEATEELENTLDVESVEEESVEGSSSTQHSNSSTQVLDRDERLFVHEVLLQVCRDLISDILHQSLGESSSRTGNNSTTCISCVDVYCGIQNLSACDFLTNKNMGIQQL